MRYAKAISWIDDTRIPFNDNEDIDFNALERKGNNNEILYKGGFTKKYETTYYKTQGRFTPNLLVCDDMLNDGSISISKQKEKNIEKKHNYNINFGVGEKYSEINDKGTNSRYYDLDKWFDKLIDEIR